jgi:hypothetical protein
MNITQLIGTITKESSKHAAIIFFGVLITFNGFYFLSQKAKLTEYSVQAKSQVMKRVALDLPSIPLAKEWIDKPDDKEQVDAYVLRLNRKLEELTLPIKVTSISTIKPVEVLEQQSIESLVALDQTVFVTFTHSANSISQLSFFSLLPSLIALLFSWLILFRDLCRNISSPSSDSVNNSARFLQIDLTKKEVINVKSGVAATISNKPLCFYCALVEFCVENPDHTLNSNSDIPEELLLISQKYFYRLIELGHTIRKRPNFESNLDKTLSEIRAALEEVLNGDIDAREKLIPPKAIGEGSRSKVHNFGLSNLTHGDVKIYGK